MALITAAAVVLLGVKQGMVVAIVASMVDHLRHSYRPRSSVLVKSPAGHWQSLSVRPGARTEAGLVVYRFGSGLYFANATALVDDILTLTDTGAPLEWLCIDAAAIGDVDYTAAATLLGVNELLRQRGVQLVLSGVVPAVREQLDRYRVTTLVGADAYHDTAGEALEAYRRAHAS